MSDETLISLFIQGLARVGRGSNLTAKRVVAVDIAEMKKTFEESIEYYREKISYLCILNFLKTLDLRKNHIPLNKFVS